MVRWLQSGLRRDICILLYGLDGIPAQKLKTRLERHYDDRIEPKQFRGALQALQRTGHVVRETEEITDVYRLTDPGRNALEEQYEWMEQQLSEREL